jgi:hypothetical protein
MPFIWPTSEGISSSDTSDVEIIDVEVKSKNDVICISDDSSENGESVNVVKLDPKSESAFFQTSNVCEKTG